MLAAAYYNEISWDQNKRPSKNFNSYGSAETEMHFSFPMPASFPGSVSAEALARSRRLLLFRAAKQLRDPAFLLHSTFACPAGHGMRAKKISGNPEQETIGRFLPGNMGRGISP